MSFPVIAREGLAMSRALGFTLLLVLGHESVQAADVQAGKARFTSECSSCHSVQVGDSGGMGPNLSKIARQAAATSDPAFNYSVPLRDSKIVWEAATLNWFLADPYNAVPGTTMQIAVPEQSARDDLIAFLLSLNTAPQPEARSSK